MDVTEKKLILSEVHPSLKRKIPLVQLQIFCVFNTNDM